MYLRKCKCGVTAYTNEELNLFMLSKSCKYGRRNKCKACAAESTRRSKGYLYPKKSAPKGTYTTIKGQSIYQRYKLSEKEHEGLLTSKGNKCQICDTKNNLVIDHCHNTKKIRGILCRKCNSGIGFLKDDISRVKRAVIYLETFD